MDQRDFLRLAKRELGLTYPALARELGVGERSLEKWTLDPASPDRRAMPLIATRFIVKLLDERKRTLLEEGDRGSAEAIDAIVAQVDPRRVREALRTFDALQRSAKRLGLVPGRPKPEKFTSFEEKNEWERNEEARHARRIRSQATRVR
jgi:transcriptional regulator with XRE-family HTH domain